MLTVIFVLAISTVAVADVRAYWQKTDAEIDRVSLFRRWLGAVTLLITLPMAAHTQFLLTLGTLAAGLCFIGFLCRQKFPPRFLPPSIFVAVLIPVLGLCDGYVDDYVRNYAAFKSMSPIDADASFPDRLDANLKLIHRAFVEKFELQNALGIKRESYFPGPSNAPILGTSFNTPSLSPDELAKTAHQAIEGPVLAKVAESYEQQEWKVVSSDLVGLLTHDEPVVYLTDDSFTLEDLADIETRDLTVFEKSSLVKLLDGKEIVTDRENEDILMLGAIRASNEKCVDCHDVEIGDLLGAFTYRLKQDGSQELLTESIR
ncbi:MAG: hypothetical protein CMJ78_15340 [Planctomycetaceae bacterium]|nr:hypothetical protein [Planctomycetaceae bacterium]